MLLDIGAERVSRISTNPLPTTPRDFWDTLGLSYEADRATSSSDSAFRAMHAAYERAGDDLRGYGGTWENLALAGVPLTPEGTYDPDAAARARTAWEGRIRQLQAERPEDADRLARYLPDAIEEGARRAAVGSLREYEGVAQVQGASVAGTLGALGAAIRDPLNILTLPLGAGRAVGTSVASRILRTAIIEGGVGGATGGATALLNDPWRQQLGLDSNIAESVAMGFLGGAIIGGGARAVTEGWRFARSRNPAADGGAALAESDAATVLDAARRDMAGSPAPGRPEVAEAHARALDEATEAVAAGRMPDPSMPVRDFMAREVTRPGVEAAETVRGAPMRVFTPAGRAVDVEPQIVELRDLIPSHTDDLTPNPAYPHAEGVQPRDRSRDASRAQVGEIAGSLEPDRLRPSPEAGNGAPIVDAENVVESGNGRVLALRRAFAENPDRAAAYRAMLEAEGYDLTGFDQPVLVSRRVSALTPDERRAFVREANSATALSMGAAERARVDADIAGRALDLYRGGDVASADNAAFVRAFMQGVPGPERGAMMGADDTLSGEGARRIRAAVLARAYGDEMGPLLERILEGEAEGLKSIAGALGDVAGPWAAMRAAVARGEIAPGMDATADLLSAVRTVVVSREKRIPVGDMLAQMDFDAPPLSDNGRAMLAAFYREAGFRGAAGRPVVADRLRGMVDEAMKTSPDPDLFGAPPATVAGIMDARAAREAGERRAPADQSDMFRGRQRAAAEAGAREAEIAAAPKVPDADFLEAQRIAAARDLPIPDGQGGTRGLRELLDEAEDGLAQAVGAAACLIGGAATA